MEQFQHKAELFHRVEINVGAVVFVVTAPVNLGVSLRFQAADGTLKIRDLERDVVDTLTVLVKMFFPTGSAAHGLDKFKHDLASAEESKLRLAARRLSAEADPYLLPGPGGDNR